MKQFGLHLTLDLAGCKGNLSDKELVHNILDKLPDKLGMTKIIKPEVKGWRDKDSKIPGISGFVMIAESHISIHTYPEKNYVFVDVFSCNEFDSDKVVSFFKEAFKAEKVTENKVKRGLDFPRLVKD